MSEKQAFVEEAGLTLEAFGLPRMAGRILGALLVADPPEMSAEELAEMLQASRGSISTMTRFLEVPGIIERVSKPGDRRTYYRNKPGAWLEVTRTRIASMSVFKELAEKGLQVVESNDPEVLRGLSEMRDYFAYWELAFPKLVAEWEAQLQKEPLREKSPVGKR